jgi:hypothetical protein
MSDIERFGLGTAALVLGDGPANATGKLMSSLTAFSTATDWRCSWESQGLSTQEMQALTIELRQFESVFLESTGTR